MQQAWNIKTRGHECARSGKPFEEGEIFRTAIYFETASGEFVRRDISEESWEEESAERQAFSSWKSEYVKPENARAKAEIVNKEGAEELLRRLIMEDDADTVNARYILTLMLERKKQLVPKERKYVEDGTMLIYEQRKTGEVFIVRDPELRLDEIESVQEEVAMLLGFGLPGDQLPPPPPVENKKAAPEKVEPSPVESPVQETDAQTEDVTPVVEGELLSIESEATDKEESKS